MAPDRADRAQHGLVLGTRGDTTPGCPAPQPPAAPHRVQPSQTQMRGEAGDVAAVVHAGRVEEDDVVVRSVRKRRPQFAIPVPFRGRRRAASRETAAARRTPARAPCRRSGTPPARFADRRCRRGPSRGWSARIFPAIAFVEHHGHPLDRSLTGNHAVDVGRKDLGRIVPAGTGPPRSCRPGRAADPRPIRDGRAARTAVRPGTGGIVQEVVRDEARRRDGPPALLAQVEHRPIDQVHGAPARDLGIGLDVRDEQLHGLQVGRDRFAQPRRDVGRIQTRMLRPGA